MNLAELIVKIAEIPSFSTYEERLHAFIYSFLSEIKGVTISNVKDNNIVVFVEGNDALDPVVITSHLDKINHFGKQFPKTLKASVDSGRIVGQMDNSVGVAVCLLLAKIAENSDFPPLYLLFSEMEESTGLKHHPHLLKNNGKDVGPQIGAERLSQYLIENGIQPTAFVTIDTTPIFKGDPGVALYTEYWEKSEIIPEKALLNKIDQLKTFILSADPEVRLANGTNDYLVYGRYFSNAEKGNVPSIAIEPAIYPYHQIGEGIFVEDINRIVAILENMLSIFDFTYTNNLKKY